jgi:hypothetical protein
MSEKQPKLHVDRKSKLKGQPIASLKKLQIFIFVASVTDQNLIHEEIKSRLNLSDSIYNSFIK